VEDLPEDRNVRVPTGAERRVPGRSRVDPRLCPPFDPVRVYRPGVPLNAVRESLFSVITVLLCFISLQKIPHDSTRLKARACAAAQFLREGSMLFDVRVKLHAVRFSARLMVDGDRPCADRQGAAHKTVVRGRGAINQRTRKLRRPSSSPRVMRLGHALCERAARDHFACQKRKDCVISSPWRPSAAARGQCRWRCR